MVKYAKSLAVCIPSAFFVQIKVLALSQVAPCLFHPWHTGQNPNVKNGPAHPATASISFHFFLPATSETGSDLVAPACPSHLPSIA